jgi:AcrR family transcriptional regulator
MQLESDKNKWQRKREASYDALVNAAMHQFHTRGYAATRVADIVAGTGYTSGAFYFHFANKTECFWHVIEHRERLRGEWAHIADDLDPSTTSLEEVLLRAFAHFTKALDGLDNWVMVMVDFYGQHRDDDGVRERLAAVYERWHGELAGFVQELQERGWADRARDADVLASQLFAAAEGFFVHGVLYGITRDQSAAGNLTDLLARLLASPE